jgi:uroporphyrinogen decarboxylase
MYRDLIKPRHAALITAIRRRTPAKIFYHSCGALMPLIDDLIDTGVDILNPIQPLPGLMDPEALKARYGDRLIFHGGLDVQSLLPCGTPDQVRDHVNHYLDALGPERYIMAPANSVQPGTPPENLVAAYETACNYRLI